MFVEPDSTNRQLARFHVTGHKPTVTTGCDTTPTGPSWPRSEYWRQPQGKWKYFEYVGLTMTILEELPAPDASQLF